MLLSWMLHLVLVSALLGVAALAGEEAARLCGKPRRWVWAAALVLSPVVAFGPWLSVRLGLPWPSAEERVTDAGVLDALRLAVPALDAAGRAVAGEAVKADPASGGAVKAVAATALRYAESWVRVLWPVCAGVALVVVAWSWFLVHRRRLRWRRRRLGRARIAVSAASGPAVVGLFRPWIVVPGWVVSDAAIRRPVFRHEAEHVRAGDTWLLALACGMVAVAPWNPVVWWQFRRLRAAVELDCDGRVLGLGERASGYGRMLLDVADRSVGAAGALATMAEPRTVLERRIRAMTERKRGKRGVRAALAFSMSAVLVVAACDMGAPFMSSPASAAQLQQAGAAQQAALHLRLRADGSFELNGRAVTAREALRAMANTGNSVPVVMTVDPREDAGVASPIERLLAALVRPSEADEAATASATFDPRTARIDALNRAAEQAVVARQSEARVTEAREAHARAATEERAAARHLRGLVARGNTIEAIEIPPERELPDGVALSGAVVVGPVRAREEEAVVRLREQGAVAVGSHVTVSGLPAGARVGEVMEISPDPELRGRQLTELKARVDLAEIAPLVVIDGVPVRGIDISTLPTDNVERIEVIKGPAATRVYGEHAAGGVIRITTKRSGGG